MNNFKPVIILEPGGRRRPGLYADIPVPVGDEGGLGGLPHLLKDGEKEGNGEGKKEVHDNDE